MSVRRRNGTLIECDAASKEILLHWDVKEQFVLRDVDETHVLVKSDWLPWIRNRFAALNDEHNFVVELGDA